jgi:hypothetical protein
MGLGQRYPLLVETTGLFDGGRSLAQQDGIASEAKDKIRPASMQPRRSGPRSAEARTA